MEIQDFSDTRAPVGRVVAVTKGSRKHPAQLRSNFIHPQAIFPVSSSARSHIHIHRCEEIAIEDSILTPLLRSVQGAVACQGTMDPW